MADWTILPVDDAPDAFGGSYPGEMRFLTSPLGCEQVALTYRRMPQHTGGKGSHGHYHKTQEELYFVISGTLQAKLDDDVIDVRGPAIVRVPPHVVRSFWNDEPGDAHLLIASTKIADPDDAVLVEDFWPE
jgi:mannose-6-phosphate isomerase-like protein (cupin superfamily)